MHKGSYMKKWTGLLGTLLLISCTEANVEDYEGQAGPKMDIREYLNGDLEAWGTLIQRDGKADPQFFVKMKGQWHGNEGTLSEDFTYLDGTKKKRLWHFTMQDDHHFTGTADDVVGIGEGKQFGNAVNMKYVLQVPYKGKTINVNMDDWLYRIDDTHVINRTQMTKFGFNAGQLVIGFRKLSSKE